MTYAFVNGAWTRDCLLMPDDSALPLETSETNTCVPDGWNAVTVSGSGKIGPKTYGIGVWNITGTNSGTINGVFQFSGFENLTGGTYVDTYLLGNAGQITGTIEGGTGNDELVITTSDNADTVTIGVPVIVRNGVQTRYLNIGTLTLNTLGGTDTITVNPAATGFPARVNVNSGMSVGLTGIENLKVAAGDGNDTITLSGVIVTGVVHSIILLMNI